MNKVVQKAFELIIVFVAIAGLILTLIGSGKTENSCQLATEILRLLFYFTIDSSLFVLLLFFIRLLAGKRLFRITENPVLSGSITINILVTGIVFILLLRSFESKFGPILYAGNIMLHYLLPPLSLIYFMIYTKGKRLIYSDVLYWLIFPAFYFIITIIRGAITGKYPYPFIDAKTLGYPKVFLSSIFILIFIIFLGAVLISINKLINKQLRR